MTIRIVRPLNRRRVLAGLGTTALVGGLACPAVSRAADRPVITHGVQSGDVTVDSGVVWARADRPARMQVEFATTESFKDVRGGLFVDALPESDFTAKAIIENLPASQDIFYRIAFQDLSSPTILGEPMVGRFRTAPADRRSVSFVWSGDVAGQGWGIDESRGGMKTYATMLKNRPDFFIHNGDTIYADGAIPAELKLPDGTHVEEHHHGGEIEAGRNAQRVPWQLQMQPAGQERPRVQRGRFRCSCSGTTTRSAITGGRASPLQANPHRKSLITPRRMHCC